MTPAAATVPAPVAALSGLNGVIRLLFTTLSLLNAVAPAEMAR